VPLAAPTGGRDAMPNLRVLERAVSTVEHIIDVPFPATSADRDAKPISRA
jgi:hypothetical protein